ncbi:hypothetical protein BC351_38420 [Paenibacillus ferrarius]|uniref:Stage II sporulation protein M n=1 Tax=Paenibacillus ferrarius TaxID=1469647 RepID=A0A1V4H9V2_9BACL|nr:stage II sporulation protein M [Paenibacillus ferrarius]OPH48274.1 hypothetical protein BC351_38420 [Paenibacillus ferrarius]
MLHSGLLLLLKKNSKILLIAGFVWVFILILTIVSMLLQWNNFIPTKELYPESVPIFEIFQHNVMLAFSFILLGNATFGVLSMLVLLLNVYITSFAVYYVFIETGSFGFSVTVILTHGILEISAMIICFILSTFTMRLAINKMFNQQIFYLNNSKQKVTLLTFMITLFFLAAVIESQVSVRFSVLFL